METVALSDGRLIMVMNGSFPGQLGGSAILVRLDSSGNKLWRKELHNTAVLSIATTGTKMNEKLVVAGLKHFSKYIKKKASKTDGVFAELLKVPIDKEYGKLTSEDPWIARMNLNGQILWQKSWDRDLDSKEIKKIAGITVMPGGDIVVAGK